MPSGTRCLVLMLSILFGAAGLAAKSAAADDAESCSKAAALEGISACERVIASGKFSGRSLAFAHYNRGLALLELGEYDRAINDFDIASRLDPTNASTFN